MHFPLLVCTIVAGLKRQAHYVRNQQITIEALAKIFRNILKFGHQDNISLMIFSFTATPEFDFMTYFARHVGATVNNGLLVIPAHLGNGYIRKLSFGSEFKITLHHYVLKEDLIIKRNTSGLGNELITIFFTAMSKRSI
jgi:hypothetical protein